MTIKIAIKKIDSEYAVQWIENGVVDEGKTYYTECKKDALETKNAIIEFHKKTKAEKFGITID